MDCSSNSDGTFIELEENVGSFQSLGKDTEALGEISKHSQ